MICVAANPSADATFSVDRLEPGAIHRPTAYVRVAGGKAMNVARAAVRLGGEAAVVALAPEHGAAWLREELEREGVTVETLPVPGVLRTCLSVFAADDGTLTEFYEGGAEIDAPTWTAFAELAAGRARADRWLAACGSLPAGAPIDAYAQVVGAGREAGAPVAVDAAGPELDVAAAAGPDLIKVNEAEALTALGREAAEPGDQARAAELAAGAARTRRGPGTRDRDARRARGGARRARGHRRRQTRPAAVAVRGRQRRRLPGRRAVRARARAGVGGVHAARDRRRRGQRRAARAGAARPRPGPAIRGPGRDRARS